MPTKKVAIIHDWLVSDRGGERVLDAILELFPDAEIFTLFYRPERVAPSIRNRVIHASFLNRLPASHRYYRYLLPLMPLAVESFDLNGFDLVISSSHCVAKGVIPPPGARHICYCHTPMRYLWDRRTDYFGGFLMKTLTALPLHFLRMWDVTSSQRVDHFIANSSWVARRIEAYYRRTSTVVHPFVDLSRFDAIGDKREDFYLVVSALVPYKRIDLAIRACALRKQRLVVVGNGPELATLQAMAGPDVTFHTSASGQALKDLYGRAKALLFPGEEDFGIVPLEAMACGTPVVAFGRGGILDSVIAGETGVFFSQSTPESLADAIDELARTPISPERCRARALQFTRERFQRVLLNQIAAISS